MRIISQDGNYDLNYDNVCISVTSDGDNRTVFCFGATSQPFPLARYSSQEKLDEVMEMLHDAYCQNQFSSRIVKVHLPTEEYRYEDIEYLFNQVRDSFVWQFPSDEEVEV